MRKAFILLALCFAMTINAKTPANKKDTPAAQLMRRLARIKEAGYMFGHQDDPFYGISWEWEHNRSDVKEVCGDYPGIMGFDLGGIEVGDAKNLDSVPFTRIREEIINHYNRGGVITVSWHPRNPLTGGTAWDVSDATVVKNMLPGGTIHEKAKTWLSRVAAFLNTLQTENGKRIPVIFRPYHENTGSWFWWGENLCSAEEYKALWNMTQDYMNNQRLDNLVWSYSPGMAADLTEGKYLERYPGNDNTDMVGVDGYQWGTENDFVEQLDANLRMLCAFAERNGKIPALTECGIKNLSDPTWFTKVLQPVVDKYPISYFLVWRNYKKEFFGPAPGHPCASDFVKLYNAKNTLFLKEIQNIK